MMLLGSMMLISVEKKLLLALLVSLLLVAIIYHPSVWIYVFVFMLFALFLWCGIWSPFFLRKEYLNDSAAEKLKLKRHITLYIAFEGIVLVVASHLVAALLYFGLEESWRLAIFKWIPPILADLYSIDRHIDVDTFSSALYISSVVLFLLYASLSFFTLFFVGKQLMERVDRTFCVFVISISVFAIPIIAYELFLYQAGYSGLDDYDLRGRVVKIGEYDKDVVGFSFVTSIFAPTFPALVFFLLVFLPCRAIACFLVRK